MNENKNENEIENENENVTDNESMHDCIVSLGTSTAKSSKGTIQCLTIVGQIEGHMILPANNKTTKYEHVMPMLASIEESEDIDALLVLLNTAGGDIEAGLGFA